MMTHSSHHWLGDAHAFVRTTKLPRVEEDEVIGQV